MLAQKIHWWSKRRSYDAQKRYGSCFAADGSVSTQLDTSKPHFPEPAKERARCSLHKWVGIEMQNKVSLCSACSVNLCTKCF